MKLQELFYVLESGELSNLSLVDPETGGIKPEHYGKIVTSANLAVTDLHTRFLIKKGIATVQLSDGKIVYPLQPRFVVTAAAKPDQNITTGDSLSTLLRILSVHDQCGRELPLNNGDPKRGVTTPTFNMLAISEPLFHEYGTRTLTVEFQKNGKLIQTCDREYDPECIEVDVDSRYMNALALFIASRLHNPSGFGTEGVHEGNNYHTLYLEECARLQNTGQSISETGFGYNRRTGFP